MITLMHERISRCATAMPPVPSELAAGILSTSNAPDSFFSARQEDMPPEIAECLWIPGLGNAHKSFNPLKLRETYPAVSGFWLGRAFEKLSKHDLAGAGRMLGCWSHLCGDTAQAAHLADERLIADLFPQQKTCYITHRTVEAISAELPALKHEPRILAQRIGELQWRAVEELAILQRGEKRELPVILNAIESGNRTAQEQSAARSAFHAAELLADVICTLLFLSKIPASGRYEAPDLRKLVPAEEFCDSYFNYRPMIDRIPGAGPYSPMPLDIGNGPEKGIAMLVYLAPGYEGIREAFAEYELPGDGSFRTFSVRCGLQRGAQNDTTCIFRVFLDGEKAAETPEIGKDSEPYVLSVDPGRAKRLRLSVTDARKDARETKFFYPVWASPQLKPQTRFQ